MLVESFPPSLARAAVSRGREICVSPREGEKLMAVQICVSPGAAREKSYSPSPLLLRPGESILSVCLTFI